MYHFFKVLLICFSSFVLLLGCNGGSGGSSNTSSGSSTKPTPVSNLRILGSPFSGQPLYASYDKISTTDAIRIQWYRDDVIISKAVERVYYVTDDDLDSNIHVKVFLASSAMPSSSAVSGKVRIKSTPANTPPFIRNPKIQGNAAVEQELRVDYQYVDNENDAEDKPIIGWYVDDALVSDTKTYVPVLGDMGKTVYALITPVSKTGESKVGLPLPTNQLTIKAALPVPNSPPMAKSVVIQGTLMVGQTLTVSYQYSDADGDKEGDSTFQWYANELPIAGATKRTYQLTASEVGKQIEVGVTPIALTGDKVGKLVRSAKSDAVKPIPKDSPPEAKNVLIQGQVKVGMTLTAQYQYFDSNGDLEGQTQFRWFANDREILGANKQSYTLQDLDAGKRIHVSVTPVALTGTETQGLAVLSAKTLRVELTAVPHPPYIRDVKSSNHGGQFGWDAVSDATHYKIYFSTSSSIGIASGQYQQVKSTTSTQHIAAGYTNGEQIFVLVTAINSTGESLPSRKFSFTPQALGVVPSQVKLNDTGLIQFADFPDWNYEDKNKPYSQRRGVGANGVAKDQGYGINLTPYDFLQTVPQRWQMQDAMHGRDAQARSNTLNKKGSGYAGFDFTKLDSSGVPLTVQTKAWSEGGNSADSTRWQCVKDNVTNLVWEIKTKQGYQNALHTYSWLSTEASTNGGFNGFNHEASCDRGDHNDLAGSCNTQAYVAKANSERLCGFDDWRLPTYLELANITMEDGAVTRVYEPSDNTVKTGVEGEIHWAGHNGARFDYTIFPYAQRGLYWTSTPSAKQSHEAIAVSGDRGGYLMESYYKKQPIYVRLVRGNGQ